MTPTAPIADEMASTTLRFMAISDMPSNYRSCASIVFKFLVILIGLEYTILGVLLRFVSAPVALRFLVHAIAPRVATNFRSAGGERRQYQN